MDHQTDRQIEERVLLRLLRSPALARAQLEVQSRAASVQLSGRVATGDAAARAKRIAERTFGVHGVETRLAIDATLESIPQRSDRSIARDAARRLVEMVFSDARARDAWLYGWEVEGDGWEIELDSDNGTVILSGDVPRRVDIVAAVVAVHDVPGVVGVFSDLRWQRRSGSELPFPRGYFPYGYPSSHPLGAYPYPWDWRRSHLGKAGIERAVEGIAVCGCDGLRR